MSSNCPWCGRGFQPGKMRGRTIRRFCGDSCRHAFHSAARRWVQQAIAAGLLTMDILKKAVPSACTAQETRSETPRAWKCTNGHDLCHGGVSAGPDCPYCEAA